ncbi:ATP-grasp domain-containing protein [Mesorhizobium sp. M1A.F.Ca.ET.072.01.1.1]|uniref:ATP-grasp domain-containing protein n=1 Tax=Mesorhizobium sp. M1A.F.Ca.ET.072.01.1.1 TaxID=2496753 RepID=UPI000FD199CD|nr:acetyl-CoA carboxylase biotin carboxylase subunit family protein [Mesorhizobium sp. M1A.F.Ca.ET.072.01.1.1]RUW54425.1 ATP-grasp domain-containing protein [Mesorhizobium sp. M1A.F.Ca.ET.072.01.1.1]TIV04816.1 MAG: ATP-grasp domain-containing protein [Mesorhizobium sp.]
MARRALILVETKSKGLGPLYVKAAQHLGLHPILLSADPGQYDYLATESAEAIGVDSNDLNALISECSKLCATHDIAGITAAGDLFYATIGKLCRHFNLPGPNPASVERCCDKFTQRKLLAEAGVPTPAYRLATDAKEVQSFAAEIGLPVIVKPAVGTGSRGVRLCRSLEELVDHTKYLLSGEHVWRSAPRILVEEFAQGPYYCAELIGDKVVEIAAGDSGSPPYFVFRKTIVPAPLSDGDHHHMTDVSLSCLRALGLGWGPTCIEFRWTNRGPVVIEVNPRLGGVPDPQLFQLAYGVDIVTEHIKLAIGEECDLRRKHSHAAAARYLVADRDGILERIDGDRLAAAVPGVAEVEWYIKPNAPIVRKGDLRDIIGYVIAASPSHAQTEAILQRAVDLIDLSITPFDPS